MSEASDREGRAASEDSALNIAVEGAHGITTRSLAWAAGGILGVVGAVTTALNLVHHNHGFGPYLLAGAFLLFFLAAWDMWRTERAKTRRATRVVRRLEARVDRQEDKVQFLEQDRDGWRRVEAEEVSYNRRLTEELYHLQRPQVSGGAPGVASTEPPPLTVARASSPPRPIQMARPRHLAPRPPDNHPRLFSQELYHLLLPQVSGGALGVVSIETPPPPPLTVTRTSSPPGPIQMPWPRHLARRPPDNHPRLFDQDDSK
jgi:hypothetical protein